MVSCSKTHAVPLVRLESATPQTRVKHSTTEPPRSYKIIRLIAYAQKPPLQAHADVSSSVRGPFFGLIPYFVYA